MRVITPSVLAATSIGAAAILCACTTTAPLTTDVMRTVEVNATYRERILLTTGHKLTVTLEDVSLADAQSVELNRVEVVLDDRTPPYRVHLEVPQSRLVNNHDYAVRAEIRDPNGNLRFTTDTRHSVLTRGAPNAATIMMIGVR